MPSVGNSLREARQAKSLTLDQIHHLTRIPVRSLEAIENDNTTVISSPFLYRSFVRQFADSVGIDFAQLFPTVQEAAQQMPQPLIPGEGVSQPRVPRLSVGSAKKVRWFTSIASLTVVLVGCSGLYAGWQAYLANPSTALANIRKPLSRLVLGTSQLAVRVRSVKMLDAFQFANTPDRVLKIPPVTGDDGFRIEVSAVEPTWLSIMADGRRSFTGTLESEQTKVLEGHETARIKTGNAGGVTVIFNGRPIGSLGPRGQIRTVLFTRDRYEVVNASNRATFVSANWNGEGTQLLRPVVVNQLF